MFTVRVIIQGHYVNIHGFETIQDARDFCHNRLTGAGVPTILEGDETVEVTTNRTEHAEGAWR